MDEKKNILDEIEILEDIEEEEILFKEDEVQYKTTYREDTSFKDSESISLGQEEKGHSLNDALTKFSTEENTVSFTMPKEEEIEIIEEEDLNFNISKEDVPFEAEGPSLSDELDNTMILAEQAINPKPVLEEDGKDDTKSNKRAIIFIVILFILLAAFVIALPFIKGLF